MLSYLSCFPHVSMNHTHCGNFHDQDLSRRICALNLSFDATGHASISVIAKVDSLWLMKFKSWERYHCYKGKTPKHTLPHNCDNENRNSAAVAGRFRLFVIRISRLLELLGRDAKIGYIGDTLPIANKVPSGDPDNPGCLSNKAGFFEKGCLKICQNRNLTWRNTEK